MDPFESNHCYPKQEAHFPSKENTLEGADTPGTQHSPRGQSDYKLTLPILRKNLNLKSCNGSSTKRCNNAAETCRNIRTHTCWVLHSGCVLQPHPLRHHHVVLQERTHFKLPGSNSDKQARQTARQQSRQETRKGSSDASQQSMTLSVDRETGVPRLQCRTGGKLDNSGQNSHGWQG